jgi:hypothetical protein
MDCKAIAFTEDQMMMGAVREIEAVDAKLIGNGCMRIAQQHSVLLLKLIQVINFLL